MIGGTSKEAYTQAIRVLQSAARPGGFFASGLAGGYEATWARDSMIASLGASLVGKLLQEPFRNSLAILAKHQSPHGQIPNAVGDYNEERKSDVTFNSIDSTLWYIIGHHVYADVFHDADFFIAHQKSIGAAYTWITYQDPNEDGLPVQQPTMDWQDAFPHKYGRVLLTQALYYTVLRMLEKNTEADRLRRVINAETEQYLSLFDKNRGYYLPWIWKTHDEYREEAHWFDTFGNLMAIISGLATPHIASRVLMYIEKEGIGRPYPCKALWPPITKNSKDWQPYFEACEARRPYHYLNGGIWPFLGGLYVAALVSANEFEKAEVELELLAKANRLTRKHDTIPEWGFYEWLDGKTGKVTGGANPYQSWSAGMYIFAYECVKRNHVPFFSR
ncbi:MAG: hypothetical protein G01um101429_741 [Parcubacteria group bacterium Gr01-1014_29]|nr:MAG: hypothetical protein G01um101429_741 [Parcubacteria group bacterium Gr01-1014_29]